MAIPILHEDEHLLAVEKPSGQVVIPARGDLPGKPLVKELEEQIGRKLFIVHRLDRGASGLVLFAKDPETHRHLSLQFEKREVQKTYQVLIQGRVESGGSIDQPLRAFGSGRMGIDTQGKASLTEYKVRELFRNATLLEVSPHSGRRHQIRVHFYSIGHPVMGDTLYGKDRPVGGTSRLMLHAWMLTLTDLGAQKVHLTSKLPADFEMVLTALRQLKPDLAKERNK